MKGYYECKEATTFKLFDSPDIAKKLYEQRIANNQQRIMNEHPPWGQDKWLRNGSGTLFSVFFDMYAVP